MLTDEERITVKKKIERISETIVDNIVSERGSERSKFVRKFPPHPVWEKPLFLPNRAEKIEDERLTKLIESGQVREMTEEEREENSRIAFVDHYCAIYIHFLIEIARYKGNDRFTCRISVGDIAEWLQNTPLSYARLEDAIVDSLNNDEERGRIEKVNTFPYEYYVPTKSMFDTLIEEMNQGLTFRLETYLINLYVWRNGHKEIGSKIGCYVTFLVYIGGEIFSLSTEQYEFFEELDKVYTKFLPEEKEAFNQLLREVIK